jgi:glyoxylase-like metal-dependent hydrolase (beta-lactamase superfamily II)
MGRLTVLGALLLLCSAPPLWGASYQLRKLMDGVYAAVAVPGGKATSNALVVVAGKRVIIAGAHFSPEGTKELLATIAKTIKLPVRAVVLSHHHRGYSKVDFDFPPAIELVTTWQTWELLRRETRELKNPVTYFDTSLTLYGGGRSLVLTNADHGHAEGNLVVYLPEEKILFASDLVFADAMGYMGDGDMRTWVVNLELLEELDVKTVVPGSGLPTDSAGLRRHKLFMKDFLSEVLSHLERGEDLATVRRTFSLPAHEGKPGYREFLGVNLERAYKDLQEQE